MLKINKKGFTLIELLAVIVVISLVLSLSYFGITSVLKNSKDKALKISEKGIVDAAKVYGTEKINDNAYWKNITDYDSKVFCVMIDELISKGLLDKNGKLPDNINKNNYVAVEKNKVSSVISGGTILKSIFNGNESKKYQDLLNVCTGAIVNESLIFPLFGKEISYSNGFDVPFTDAKSTDNSKPIDIDNSECSYSDDNGITFKTDGKIKLNTNNKCILDGVTSGSYYVRLCQVTKKKSEVCSTTTVLKTANIPAPNILIDNNNVKIEFKIDNIRNSSDSKFYFKAPIGAKSNVTIYDKNGNATNEVKVDEFYWTNSNNVSLTFSSKITNGTVTAYTKDVTGNKSENATLNFNVYESIFKKENADKIGNGTTDIKKYCVVASGSKCDVISPSISKDDFDAVGWGTSSNSTTSSWNAGVKKSINSSNTYYPIFTSHATIRYSVNGGSVKTETSKTENNVTTKYYWKQTSDGIVQKASSSGGTYNDFVQTIKNGDKIEAKGLKDYNNSKYLEITRSNYSAKSGIEWICIDGCTGKRTEYSQTSEDYVSTDFCDTLKGNCTMTVGVNWQMQIFEISLDKQNGTGGTSTIYEKYGSNFSLNSSGSPSMLTNSNPITKPTRNGYTFGGYYTSTNGNGTQIISSTGYIVSGKSSTFASNSKIYAKWTADTFPINFNANGGTGGPKSQTKTYGVNLVLTTSKPTRTGYNFKGWATSSTSKTVQYKSGDTFTGNSTTTLYAVWKDETKPKLELSIDTGTTWCSGKKLTLTCTDTGSGMKQAYMNDNGTETTGTTSTYQSLNSVRNSSSNKKKTYVKCTDKEGNYSEGTYYYTVVTKSCTAYNSCRNSAFGCATYNSCRNSAFGCATYNSCRNASFGCAVYNSWNLQQSSSSRERLSSSQCKDSIGEYSKYISCVYKQETCKCAHWTRTCKTYNSKTSSLCGCKTYNSRAASPCSCKTYNLRAASPCSCKTYNCTS